jgi:hypothetical protein
MNTKRILWGGLAAGVLLNVTEAILNAGILMDDYSAILEAHQLTEASWAMAGYIVSMFVMGIAVAWLYAALRPRFGAGWGTAMRAGVLLWFTTYLIPSIWMGAMGMGFGMGGTLLSLAWGLVEITLAGMLAGWIYQEADVPVQPAGVPTSEPRRADAGIG